MSATSPPVMASREIKTEVHDGTNVEPIDLESRIIELLVQFPEGMSNDELGHRTPNIETSQRITAINRLLSIGRVEMKKIGAGSTDFLLKLRSDEAMDKIKGASPEEGLVYQLIEETNNKGIWIRDIRNKSGLSQAQLTKVLKALEIRKLVKSIKAVGAGRKKAYMLYELDPDESLTGGTFYSDQEFDVQFVDLLNQQCVKFLRARAQLASERHPGNIAAQKQSSYVCSNEVWQHIRDLQISKVELTVKDVERILDTTVYDGETERHLSGAQSSYRYVNAPLEPSGLVNVPCTFCPVFADCYPDRVISPASCVYFKDWLSEI